jgi:hypothetical protein
VAAGFPLSLVLRHPDGREETREDLPLDHSPFDFKVGEQLTIDGEEVVEIGGTGVAAPEQDFYVICEPCEAI